MTPFEALYGYQPPTHTVTNLSMEVNPTVEEWRRDREQMLQVVRERLQEAQNRMKQNADKRRVDKEYKVGEKVYLKLQPYRQSSVAVRRRLKLSSKYYGPYEILQRVGPVAYRLQLPEDARVHPVFHVSQLKKGIPAAGQDARTELQAGEDGQLLTQPEQILGRRIVEEGNRASSQVLVKWSNLDPKEATWEDCQVLKAQYPSLIQRTRMLARGKECNTVVEKKEKYQRE